MSRPISKRTRRTSVVVNYLSLVLLVVFFIFVEYGVWKYFAWTGVLIAGALFVMTFHQVYYRTGLWRFVHTPAARLDEREIQVVYRSLQYSYGLYAVVCLIYIFVLSLVIRFSFPLLTDEGHFSFGFVMLMGLIYLSHILPASIIAWTEREVFAGPTDDVDELDVGKSDSDA